jgi:Flp pilus assembly CpaF family ATPase
MLKLLRMRPSRIIVGEVRKEECLDLLIALNSGLPESSFERSGAGLAHHGTWAQATCRAYAFLCIC